MERRSQDPQPVNATAMIGRDNEIQRMAELFDRVSPGRPAVVVVEGPPGIGRTRLLAEFAAEGVRRGAAVVFEHAQARPRRILFVGDPGRPVGPDAWGELDRLAESTPVLVAMRGPAGPAPVLAGSTSQVHRIRLDPLSPADVRRLATLLLGARPDPRLLDLTRVAAGRPGVLRDLIAGLEEEDLIRVAGGVAGVTDVRLPARLRTRLGSQVDAMSPTARHLLQAATMLTTPFLLTRLSRMMRASLATLLPAIEEVLDSGLLVSTPDGLLTFSHKLVRPIVEASMPRAVVAALRAEQTPATRPPRPASPPRVAAATRPGSVDWGSLSGREREIAALVGQALTNQQVATRVGRSPHTVNYHLRQIFRKLGLTSRVELVSLMRQREAADVRAAGPS